MIFKVAGARSVFGSLYSFNNKNGLLEGKKKIFFLKSVR